MPAPKSYVVVNQRPQPVELHTSADVVVLGPYESAEVPQLTGQVVELARRRLITVEEHVQAREPKPAAPATKKKAAAPAARRAKAARPAKVLAQPTKAPAKPKLASHRTKSRRGGN
jgi:hypothetical protein